MLAEDPALLSKVKRSKVVSRFDCRTIQGKAVRVLQMITLVYFSLLQVEVEVQILTFPKNPRINPRPQTQPKQRAETYVAFPRSYAIGLQ